MGILARRRMVKDRAQSKAKPENKVSNEVEKPEETKVTDEKKPVARQEGFERTKKKGQ